MNKTALLTFTFIALFSSNAFSQTGEDMSLDKKKNIQITEKSLEQSPDKSTENKAYSYDAKVQEDVEKISSMITFVIITPDGVENKLNQKINESIRQHNPLISLILQKKLTISKTVACLVLKGRSTTKNLDAEVENLTKGQSIVEVFLGDNVFDIVNKSIEFGTERVNKKENIVDEKMMSISAENQDAILSDIMLFFSLHDILEAL